MERIINELKQLLVSNQLYSGLYISLSLIDACSVIEYSREKKVSKRYEGWLQNFYIPLYERDINNPIVTAADIYNLRCSVLHQGTNVIGKDALHRVILTDQRSHRNKCIVVSGNQKIIEKQLNTKRFIGEIINCIEVWMSKTKKDFTLDFSIFDKNFNSTNLNGAQAMKNDNNG